MPELPEVETVRRQLDQKMRGKIISQVHLLRSGRETPKGVRFTRTLQSQHIISVDRRAKLLIWCLASGQAVTAHLKMTGRFVFQPKTYLPTTHDRALFHFTDLAEILVWSDVRQFGFMHLVSGSELEKIVSAYGPEPLDTPAQELAERLRSPKTRRVKQALLDQCTIAGIGNIYADEACFRAKIKPTTKLGKLTAAQRLKLAQAIKQVLTESLAQKGTSANDYVDTKGERGGFLELLQVYGRAGEPCITCQTPIKKIILNQRGTHFCPVCQK